MLSKLGKVAAASMLLIMAMDVSAGYGRGGSSGGFRSGGSSYRSSYSSSYSRPSYRSTPTYAGRSYASNSHTTVVNNHHSSSGGGGIGSHLGAGILGYMMGQNSHPTVVAPAQPVYVNGQPAAVAGYVPPVGQPVGDMLAPPMVYQEPHQTMGILGVIFWSLFFCFAMSVLVYWIRTRGHCEHH
jgi:hypothetical protein